MIGLRINQYTITAKIGAGGMGEVYLAEDRSLSRKVALKFLPPALNTDPESRERFQREARALAALNHPNIVTVHEVSNHEGNPFIVMEYLEGQSLKQAIADGEIEVDTALKIAGQIAEGLSVAHDAGIVHRDIKADNIQIAPSGRVRIMDFGLSTWRDATQLTRDGSTLGTVAYMSPEQAQAEEVDHRSDLWSLGVVLYETLTGQLPFEGVPEAAMLYSIVNEQPVPVADHQREIPDFARDIIMRLLEKDVARRYQSAADVLVDLQSPGQGVKTARPTPRRGQILRRVVAPVAIGFLLTAAFLILPRFVRFGGSPSPSGRTMLAVLPFGNLGSEDQEYFADGITDEIIGKLASIPALGVISRTTIMQYKNSKKDLRTIGAELAVEYILEGTIRWDRSGDTDRVRIRPQLIRVSDDTPLWTEAYERPVTQVFALQTDIAEKVANALNITLLASERDAIDAPPTEDFDAYQAYLRGVDFMRRPDHSYDDLQMALQLLKRAITLDPDFAHAHAAISIVHSSVYWYHRDREGAMASLPRAKDAAERALDLEPLLLEAHLALGQYYYWGSRNYESALEELVIAESCPGDHSRVLEIISYIQKRQGTFQEASETMERAMMLSPRDPILPKEMGIILSFMRRYEEADENFLRSIALAPDQTLAYAQRITNSWRWHGDPDLTQAMLEEMPRTERHSTMVVWFWQAMYERRYTDAMTCLSRIRDDDPEFVWTKLGWIAEFMADPEQAATYYDSARVILEEKNASCDQCLASSGLLLGQAYAGLGLHQEALREVERNLGKLPISKDAVGGSLNAVMGAGLYAALGERKRALDQVEYLLSIPSPLTVPMLKIDPRWDPIREDPRFQAFLE